LTPAQLASGGLLTPSLTLKAPVGINWVTTDLAFDSAGNMWLAVEIIGPLGMLALINAADLNATGDTTLNPEITISPAPIGSMDFSVQCPSGLAFDDRGNLWLANACSSYWGDIVEFTPDELGVSGSPLPKVVLRSNKHGTNLDGPNSILFGPLAP
jgi:DNA-binding beta-propeller fold protein YncE